MIYPIKDEKWWERDENRMLSKKNSLPLPDLVHYILHESQFGIDLKKKYPTQDDHILNYPILQDIHYKAYLERIDILGFSMKFWIDPDLMMTMQTRSICEMEDTDLYTLLPSSFWDTMEIHPVLLNETRKRRGIPVPPDYVDYYDLLVLYTKKIYEIWPKASHLEIIKHHRFKNKIKYIYKLMRGHHDK